MTDLAPVVSQMTGAPAQPSGAIGLWALRIWRENMLGMVVKQVSLFQPRGKRIAEPQRPSKIPVLHGRTCMKHEIEPTESCKGGSYSSAATGGPTWTSRLSPTGAGTQALPREQSSAAHQAEQQTAPAAPASNSPIGLNESIVIEIKREGAGMRRP